MMIEFLRPPEVSIFDTKVDPFDVRLKNIIYPWQDKKSKRKIDVGILGIPFDLGVKLSGGRVGAAKAPDAIRAEIKRYGTAYNVVYDADLSKISIVDFGNVDVVPSNTELTHNRVTQVVQKLLTMCDTLIVLGGGNDLSFATVHGLKMAAKAPIGGMNVDAHLDVRKVLDGRITSGTPYRLLLESGILEGKNFFEAGLQGHTNSKHYWDWAKERGVRLYPLHKTRRIGINKVIAYFQHQVEKLKATFVSIDIDVVAQAFAPGSSAPSPDGLFPTEILQLAYWAGQIPNNVRLFEIMEVNPEFDQDNRTSRLAVNIIANFLAGYTQRKS